MKLKSFVISIILYCWISFCHAASSSSLSYSYSIPWSGGATITLYNHSNAPITISNFIFTTNTYITGSPWGTLYSSGSTLTSVTNPDGVHVTHTITEATNVQIPAQINSEPGSVVLTYSVGKINGVLSPYNAAMDPTEVKVSINGELQAIDIQNKCIGNICQDPGNGKYIVGYFINWAHWRAPKFDADDKRMAYDKINTLNYAFAIFDSDGNVSLYDQDSDQVNLPIISQKRKQLSYLNASLAFGGWSWASTPPGWHCQVGASPEGPAACFSLMASNRNARANFVKKAVSAMQQVNFNGIDIDWEYPDNPADIANFVQLIKELRAALNTQENIDQTKYHLTIATSASVDRIQNFTTQQWQDIVNNVDYVGVMTYDFHGGWDQGVVGSDFQSAMQIDPINDPTIKDPLLSQFSVKSALEEFVKYVPAEKLVVGIPMYGRMVNISGPLDKPGNSFGLYRTISGIPVGEFDNQQSGFTGVLNYNCIVDKTVCGNGYHLPDLTLVDYTQNSFGAYSLTPWGYSDSLFVTYDDATSASFKANWVVQQHFAGIMLWDLTGDFNDTDERSIINSIYKAFQNSYYKNKAVKEPI